MFQPCCFRGGRRARIGLTVLSEAVVADGRPLAGPFLSRDDRQRRGCCRAMQRRDDGEESVWSYWRPGVTTGASQLLRLWRKTQVVPAQVED